MFWDLIFGRAVAPVPAPAPVADAVADVLTVGTRQVPLRLVRHPRARKYLLRLLPDGTARVTIPRAGSAREARQFAARQSRWLEQQFQRLESNPAVPADWQVGSQILFRGELTTVESRAPDRLALGGESIRIIPGKPLRPAIQQHLRKLAARELPARVGELARQHGVTINRISVRNQRTRWGSCSRHGAISLNWRLIQTPPAVSDYIILHELMHRRQLNHSAKYWQEVAAVCPEYQKAERWLKQHSALLG